MTTAEKPVTLSHAAEALGISPSTLRRWADAGRIDFVRTSGGHRRFPAREVLRLKSHGADPSAARVRPIAPPTRPLPALARLVAGSGVELAGDAAAALYGRGPGGWFGSEEAEAHLHRWVHTVALACLSGAGRQAVSASLAMLHRSELAGASLLERYLFVENVGNACRRALQEQPDTRGEAAAAHRLFRSISQSLIDG